MTHRSKLAGFIIDCRTDDLEGAATFWSEALGLPRGERTAGKYVKLEHEHLSIEVQKVEHESRVHLDIQADDVEAEVARLEKLGAKRVEKINTWWVMEAPTGQRFCVVRVQTGDFAETAHVHQ